MAGTAKQAQAVPVWRPSGKEEDFALATATVRAAGKGGECILSTQKAVLWKNKVWQQEPF